MKRLILLLISYLLACSVAMRAQDSGASASSSGASSSSAGSASSGGVGMIVGSNYVLKPSDVIEIEVYQEQDLNKTVRIELSLIHISEPTRPY